MSPFSYLPPEKQREAGPARAQNFPSSSPSIFYHSKHLPRKQALGETGGSWNCLNSSTDTTGNKTTCAQRRAEPTEQMFACSRNRTHSALSPPVAAAASAKGHAGRANPFPNMLRSAGFTVVKGRKGTPSMESLVHRFGTSVKALGFTARWCWEQGTSNNRKHGEPFMFSYG